MTPQEIDRLDRLAKRLEEYTVLCPGRYPDSRVSRETLQLEVSALRRLLREHALAPFRLRQSYTIAQAVLYFFFHTERWTTESIKRDLMRNRKDITGKQISNALGYLTRKKYIRRLGYGLYEVIKERTK